MESSLFQLTCTRCAVYVNQRCQNLLASLFSEEPHTIFSIFSHVFALLTCIAVIKRLTKTSQGLRLILCVSPQNSDLNQIIVCIILSWWKNER